jgi:histidinol-phosphatase (PHP family)
MIADYHVHTRWSDGQGAAADLIAAAAALGLPEIGLADHLVHPSLGYGMPPERLSDYVAEIRRAAAAAEGAHVLLGVEVDYTPETWPLLTPLLRQAGLDYVIGSLHFVGGVPFDVTAREAERHWPDADVLFARYYRGVARLAATGAVDVIGHLDLPKKFGRRPTAAVAAEADAALDAIAAAGVLVEINTSGLRCPAAEPYPAAALLARARARGIGITFGSDAHRPREVGEGFAEALVLACSVGYTTYARPSDRTELPLP